MTKTDAIRHFKTRANLARELGISKQAVSNWPEELPEGRQYQIEILTGGKLKADRSGENAA